MLPDFAKSLPRFFVAIGCLTVFIGSATAYSQSSRSSLKPTSAKKGASSQIEQKSLKTSSAFSKISGDWTINFSAGNSKEGLDESTAVSLLFKSNLDYELNKSLKVASSLGFSIGKANIQTTSKTGGDNGLTVSNIALVWSPFEIAELHIGAINQGFSQSPLVVSSLAAFPGVRESLIIDRGDFKIEVSAAQTVPTSTTLNTNLSEKEKSPSFFNESLTVEFLKKQSFNFGVNTSHFKYTNLPSIVAYESSLLGNTTNGEVNPSAEFTYDFEGFTYGGYACLCLLDSFQLRIESNFVENIQAPEAFNRARSTTLRGKIGNSKLFLEPYIGSFFVESDAAPAFYASQVYGGTNRQGEKFGVGFNFENLGFKLAAEYIETTPINESLVQENSSYFQIMLETAHVRF